MMGIMKEARYDFMNTALSVAVACGMFTGNTNGRLRLLVQYGTSHCAKYAMLDESRNKKYQLI
jgi:hypothetical protein